MGSLTERYHGPHCFWVTCQHPCCWEAERRVAKGISPQVKSSRECAPTNDEIPTLTVVDVSQWIKGKEKTGPNPLNESISTDSLMCVPSYQNTSLRHLKEQNRKSERKLQFPPLNCVDSTNQSKQQVKLNTAWIEPLASCPSPTRSSDMLVLWVPSPEHTPVAHAQNSEERAKSPHVAVKEIFCLPPSETLIKSNIKKKTRVRKQVRFQLSFSPSTSPEITLAKQFGVHRHTAGSRQAEADTQTSPLSDQQAPNTIEQRPDSAPTTNKTEDPFVLRNKPVVFHDIRERKLRKVPTDVQIMYKLDRKDAEEGVNWQSLRAQAYLWKKHKLWNNQEKDKAVPPEGAAAPQSPQLIEHLCLTGIPQAAALHHQKNPLIKEASAGKTCHQHSSPLGSQSKSILKVSFNSRSSQVGQNPLHHPLDTVQYEVPIKPSVIVPSTSKPLQPEECPRDLSGSDVCLMDSAGGRRSAGADSPRCSQVTPPALHSPRSKRRLHWADLESGEPEPESESESKVSCPELTAPPPSRETQHIVPIVQLAIGKIK